MAYRNYLAGEVAEDFADGLLSRREALRRLGLLGLSAAGASTLLAACGGGGGDDSETSGTTDFGFTTTSAPGSGVEGGGELIRFPGLAGELQAAWATPEAPKAGVLVIHENRGLTDHFFDLVGRLSREGYAALAVDLASRQGGTGVLGDPAAVSTALGDAEEADLLADLEVGLNELARRVPEKKLGAVGFCFGGALAWSLVQAGEARLSAVVPFYGPVPETPDFSKSLAAVLGVYAEKDDRVNASRERAEAALKAAGLTYEIRTFAGADHAFFNDTGQRYNAAAAKEAWTALLDWFARYLAA